MLSQKAIDVSFIVAMLIIFSDARYLLVKLDEGNERGESTKEIFQPQLNMTGLLLVETLSYEILKI